MQVLLDKLHKIEGKLRSLIDELALTRNENITLKQENENLRETIDQQKDSLKELGKELLDVGFGVHKDQEQEALKKKLAHYIDEVDKCLEMVKSVE